MKRIFRWLFGPSKSELTAQIEGLRHELHDVKFEHKRFRQEIFTSMEKSLSGNDIRDKLRSIDFKPIVENAIANYVGKLVQNIDLGGNSVPKMVQSRVVVAICKQIEANGRSS